MYILIYIFVSDFFTTLNFQLPSVDEEDKEFYLRDYLEEIKKTSFMEIVTNQITGEKLFRLPEIFLVGVVSKPL